MEEERCIWERGEVGGEKWGKGKAVVRIYSMR